MQRSDLNKRIEYYNIPVKERNLIKKYMFGKTCLNCQIGCCNVELADKRFNEDVNCLGWVNYRMVVDEYNKNQEKAYTYTKQRKY